MNSMIMKLNEYYYKGINKLKRILFRTGDPIYNTFHAQHSKYALLSYITSPFKLGVTYRHNNTLYVLEIAKILDSLGYNVDVMDYKDSRKRSYDKYDLILGFGEPFNASYANNSHAVRIFYGTTMYPPAQNKASIIQLQKFYKKHHVWLVESTRIENRLFSLQTQAVDAIIMYGNELIQASYRETYDGPIIRLHNMNFVFRSTTEVLAVQKNWETARNKFCLFPAAGMLHKGVDVVLDLFSKHPEWDLYLGAPFTREPRFFAIYKDILNLPNIHFQGFVDMTKQGYWDILDECGFFLSPSASEGCPTSVINACTNGKIIPIATRESGLEPAEFNIPIDEISEDSLEKSIKIAQELSNEELDKRATEAHLYFSTAHSKETYQKELTAALQEILHN